MADIQDFRAGNQVLFSASLTRATILKSENDRVLLKSFPENLYCSKAEISGIPLTVSLLQQLSFTNDEDVDTWFGEGIKIHVKPDGFFYGLRIEKSRAKMQYLHQLQNYVSDFYALFREESHILNVDALN